MYAEMYLNGAFATMVVRNAAEDYVGCWPVGPTVLALFLDCNSTVEDIAAECQLRNFEQCDHENLGRVIAVRYRRSLPVARQRVAEWEQFIYEVFAE